MAGTGKGWHGRSLALNARRVSVFPLIALLCLFGFLNVTERLIVGLHGAVENVANAAAPPRRLAVIEPAAPFGPKQQPVPEDERRECAHDPERDLQARLP